jgi:two-component system heavy metal sensor histidine kinase CusS
VSEQRARGLWSPWWHWRQWTLTARLTVGYALTSALVLLGLGGVAAWAIDAHFVEMDKELLHDKIRLVWHTMAQSPTHWREHLTDLVDTHPTLRLEVRQDQQVLFASTPTLRFPSALSAGLPLHATPPVWADQGTTWRGWAMPFVRPDMRADDGVMLGSTHAGYLILAAIDTHHHAHFMSALRQTLAVYVALALLVSSGLGWWTARRGLAPLRAMQRQAQAVSPQRLHERMPDTPMPVELAELAQSLNGMLARLQADFQRLTDFSSDLAHELRTPISTLLTQTQVMLSQPRTSTEYREVLASNAEELQHLARMVSDMLFLAKAEHHLVLPNIETLHWADELNALLEFYDPLAQDKGIRMSLHGQVTVQGDKLMLRRAASNLLSNALRHTPKGGEVRVELWDEATHVCLRVCNTGPTIPAEALPRLFDRFYRADPARSHAQGAGLGLAITQAIVRAHGGKVTVKSDERHTSFTVSVPWP